MTDIIHTTEAAPPGYQHTNAGVLPNEWASRPLSSIVEEIAETAGTRKIETVSISAGIGFVNQAEKFGRELSGKQYEKYTVLHQGDFSYNKGNSNLYPQGCIYRLNDRTEAAVPNVFESFRVADGDPDYYEQLFISGFLNKQLYSKINRGVRDDGLLNLTGKDFFSCEVPFPPLAEQKKIAEILAQCDKVIDLKQKKIDKLIQFKKECLRKMFPAKGHNKPEIRFPGFTGAWEQRKLGDVLQTLPFKPYLKLPEQDGKYEIIQQGNEPIIGYANGNPCCDYKDTVIFGDHTLSLYKPRSPFFVATDGVRIIKGKQYVEGNYLLALLEKYKPQSEGYKRYFSILSDCECYISENNMEQHQIGVFFQQLDNLITLHQRELDETQKYKKALLQLLLTGIVRVNA